MDAAAELGRNPVSKHHIQPEYGDEQAEAGRDCRTRLARPSSQARTRTGKYSFSLYVCKRTGWEGERVDRLRTERHPGVWHSGGLKSDGVKV